MRESRLYGSVRGALSNERPYRVPQLCSRTLLHLLRSAAVQVFGRRQRRSNHALCRPAKKQRSMADITFNWSRLR